MIHNLKVLKQLFLRIKFFQISHCQLEWVLIATEWILDLDYWSELIIFQLILINFKLSGVFLRQLGQYWKLARVLTQATIEKFSLPKFVKRSVSVTKPQQMTSLFVYLAALDALGGELVLVALGAVDVMLLGDERPVTIDTWLD
jgi:hypothetical protein